jgi:hypothetical protein
MANAEKVLYTAGNPGRSYAAIPAESAYTEVDRENSRLTGKLALLRGELNETQAELKAVRSRAWWLGVVVGLYTAGGMLAVGIYLAIEWNRW